ncbi:MAG: hypothetical protein HY381_02640 [Candidatus Chisholmbacteria bacterium]|nr:hypothetical protein [Candidatus Chisholmbacteria bacterium]
MKLVKVVVFVPEAYANKIRQVLGEVGAGRLGKYSYCSFSVTGVGRFKPMKGAKPTVGKVGGLEEVAEERIETVCYERDLKKVLQAIKVAHPYEEPAIDVYPLLTEI